MCTCAQPAYSALESYAQDFSLSLSFTLFLLYKQPSHIVTYMLLGVLSAGCLSLSPMYDPNMHVLATLNAYLHVLAP